MVKEAATAASRVCKQVSKQARSEAAAARSGADQLKEGEKRVEQVALRMPWLCHGCWGSPRSLRRLGPTARAGQARAGHSSVGTGVGTGTGTGMGLRQGACTHRTSPKNTTRLDKTLLDVALATE